MGYGDFQFQLSSLDINLEVIGSDLKVVSRYSGSCQILNSFLCKILGLSLLRIEIERDRYE